MNRPSSFDPDPAGFAAALLAATSDAVFCLDPEGRIQRWNSAAVRLLGHGPDAWLGRHIAALTGESDAGDLARLLSQISETQRMVEGRASFITADRGEVRAHLTLKAIDGADGTLSGFVVLARPVQERALGELSMQIADARWRALIDAAVDGMIVIDGKGLIEVFNPAAERMFGYRVEHVLGQNVRILMPAPDRDRHDQYLARYLETGQQRIIGIGRDVTALRRDGTHFPVHLAVGEMRVAGEPHFVGIVHDLSARAKLEERVREQASLAQLGEMAAVLAHEVKNPLAAVRGAIQVLGKRYSTSERDATVVKEILSRLDGLNELVQDLLLFARTPTPRPAPVELRLVLEATVGLLAKDPGVAEVRVDIAGGGSPISVDVELMKIAFQNILLNAAQALGGHGLIDVTISDGGDRQVVAIRDRGPGMSPETRARLFQPFFTTKARGTGLGLATVRRLVEAHEGSVSVDCPPEGGTTVTIELPLQRKQAQTAAKAR